MNQQTIESVQEKLSQMTYEQLIQLIMNTAAKRKQTLYSNTVFQSQDYEKFLPIKDKI